MSSQRPGPLLWWNQLVAIDVLRLRTILQPPLSALLVPTLLYADSHPVITRSPATPRNPQTPLWCMLTRVIVIGWPVRTPEVAQWPPSPSMSVQPRVPSLDASPP